MNRLLLALVAALVLGAVALVAWLVLGDPAAPPVASPGSAAAAGEPGSAGPITEFASTQRSAASSQPSAGADRGAAADSARDPAAASAGPGQSLSGKLIGPLGELGGAQLVLLSSAGATLSRAASRADGTFVLALTVPCSDAGLSITAEGCAPFRNGPWRVALAERRFVGVIRLERAGTLTGRVVDRSGAPVADARVLLRASSNSRPPNQHVEVVASGPDGGFTFAAAPESPVRLEAWRAGHGARTFDVQRGPASQPVVIMLGEPHELSARVRSIAGEALAGAHVVLVSTARDVPGADLTTDETGLARVEGLGAAHFGLRVEAHGFRPEVLGSVPADGREIPLALKAWPSIRGRLIADGGKPLDGAVVRALAVDHEGRAIQASSSAVDHGLAPDGSFVIDDLRPGFYCVEAQAPDLAPCRSGSLQLLLDRPPPLVELRLHSGATLSVTITAGGAPLAQASIEVYDVELSASELWRGPSPQRRALAVAASDSAGRAALEHLPSGASWVVVRARERLATMVGPYQLDGGETRDIGRVELARGGGLNGVVVDARGQPVEGASVVLAGTSAPRASAQLLSDTAGCFTSQRLPGGSYRATAREAGRNASLDCWITEGEDAEIRLELK